LDRLKRLKCRYNKTEREHEYKEELVKSIKTTFEKQFSGMDEPMQEQAFDHDNQDPFLDSEYRIQELYFAIKNRRVQWNPRLHEIDYLIIRNLPNEALEIPLEMYDDILRARVFPEDWNKYRAFFILKRQNEYKTYILWHHVCASY
jgi:hypothetical protein